MRVHQICRHRPWQFERGGLKAPLNILLDKHYANFRIFVIVDVAKRGAEAGKAPPWIRACTRCFDLNEGRSCNKSPKFSNFTTKNPKIRAKNLNFAVDIISATRRPCRGFRLQSQVGKLGPLSRTILTLPQCRDYTFYRSCTILTTCFPKKLENFVTEKNTAFYASPDCPPTSTWLMSFIGQTTKTFTDRAINISRKNVWHSRILKQHHLGLFQAI